MHDDNAEDEDFLLVAFEDHDPPHYAVFKRLPIPVLTGGGGVPVDGLELLLRSGGAVRAARILPEQARTVFDKGVSAAMADDQNHD